MSETSIQRCALTDLEGQVFDLLVIGGGITGAGVALDAQTRGLRTLLVEKDDFASGTSSKSTKLVHGGLRYLQNLQFKVTAESVRERQQLQLLAPHLVKQIPFVVPLYAKQRLHNLKLSIGLHVYDRLAGKRGTGKHKRISRDEVLKRCPGIREKGLVGGFVFFDCQTDDARLVLDVIKTAVSHGATALNHTKVTAIVKNDGVVSGVEVVDQLTGATAHIKADAVVNATGVWMQTVSQMTGEQSSTEVAPSKGVHIVVPSHRLPITSAMIVDSVYDKRFCFAVPWLGSVLIGTTDEEYRGDVDNIEIRPDEVGYILAAVNNAFPELHLTPADVTGVIAGVRPLVREVGAREGGNTAAISREHFLEESRDGLISIAGGKLTTYRPMAEEVVDMVVRQLQKRGLGSNVSPCRTAKIMLGGFSSMDDFLAVREEVSQQAIALGLGAATAHQLLHDYGKDAFSVLDLVRNQGGLSGRITCSQPYILAQVTYSVRHESARKLDDVLARRTRMSVLDRTESINCAGYVAWTMAQELSWTEEERRRQLQGFLAKTRRQA